MDIITKTQYIFDHVKVVSAVENIISLYPDLSQIGLTHTDRELSEIEKITESIGSLFDYDTKSFRYKETDFCIFNEAFKNTYIYEMYKSLPDIGRVRIMIMDGPNCYTIHKDLSKRYHYVIETNLKCFFLFPRSGEQIHIPADNSLYAVDTTLPHTFVNGSRKRRIHLVFDDISTLRSI